MISEFLHPQAGRHAADVVRAGAGGAVRLQVPAGCSAAQRGIPGRQRVGATAGRLAADHGHLGGDAAHQAVLDDCRHRFDLDHEFAGLDLDRHPVRAEPRHRRGRRRRAGGDRAHPAPASARDDGAAELPQGQPGRRADPPAFAGQRHGAHDRSRRLRRERHLALALHHRGRGAGVDLRPAKYAVASRSNPTALAARGISIDQCRRPRFRQQHDARWACCRTTSSRSPSPRTRVSNAAASPTSSSPPGTAIPCGWAR